MGWFHVTPLFLLPSILASGGLRCGADLAASRSPRRRSSRQYDEVPLAALGEQTPADCIMLFGSRTAARLLYDKIKGRPRSDQPWKAFPHIRLDFSPERCLALAGGKVYGSLDNVGRVLRGGGQPRIQVYKSAK